MDKLDETDNNLIKLLEQNAWQRSETLANVLHVSPATIRRRLRRLIQKGVLRAVAIADSGTAAPTLNAVIALNIAHQDIVTTLLIGSHGLRHRRQNSVFNSIDT